MGGKPSVEKGPVSCEYLPCSNVALPDSIACPTHVCKVKICNELKTASRPFCIFHCCHVDPDCLLRSMVFGNVCSKHKKETPNTF